MAPRRRCPTCGSKQWHKEPSSGLIACSEGHVLQNYRNETTEVEEMGPHAMKKRALKSGKRKKGKGSNADPKLYHGARGRFHYFLCLQVLLRKQIAVLTTLWDLPPEFEVICKDLWALHLSLLPDPPPAEPYHNAEGGGHSEDANQGSSSADPDIELDEERFSDDGQECQKEGEYEDPELEDMMREISEISCSSDDEGEEAPAVTRKRQGKRKGRLVYESPLSTLSVLVVACWTLRIPMMYQDFYRIIESYKLPYLDPLTSLPPSMVQHLTKHNIQALSPPHGPRTTLLHSLASRLARKLYGLYGIYTPEVNASSMLWRLIKGMGGTPVLYLMTKRLSSVLSLPLTLDVSLAPGLQHQRDPKVFRHQYDNVAPEVSLIAALLIVLKMVYGLDGSARKGEEDDVGDGLRTGSEYLKELKKMEGGKERMIDSEKELKVDGMSESMIDEYIEFCEKSRIGQGQVKGEGVLDRFFPLGLEGKTSRESAEVADGGGAATEERDDGLRRGEGYKIWNGRDVDGEMAGSYPTVLTAGGRLVGVSGRYLGGIVEKYERRLIRRRLPE